MLPSLHVAGKHYGFVCGAYATQSTSKRTVGGRQFAKVVLAGKGSLKNLRYSWLYSVMSVSLHKKQLSFTICDHPAPAESNTARRF